MKSNGKGSSVSIPKKTWPKSQLNPLAAVWSPRKKESQEETENYSSSSQDAQRTTSLYSFGRKISEDITLIDTIGACRSAVEQLLKGTEIAIDIEGANLCRNGSISLIQICTIEGHVFLFDITTLRKDAFDHGKLQSLLENTTVQKVLFDGRADNDALYHLYKVKMERVYDLQILYTIKFSGNTDPYLKSLAKCLNVSGVVDWATAQRLNALKKRGKKLYAPELGGSYAVWDNRPLCGDLIKYAAADVKYLLAMKKKWSTESIDKRVEQLAKERIEKTLKSTEEAKGRHMCKRDFDV